MQRWTLASFAILLAGITTNWAIPLDSHASVIHRLYQMLHQEPPAPSVTSRASVETKWIEQKLDNFDETNTRTWQMRYMSNDEFYQEGGPLFIFVGGEWTITPPFLLGGHMYDMAKEHHGYLFYTEHRFYGDSRPTSDLSVENLKYLNVRQALADLAHFIRTMKKEIPGMSNSKVILVGGSYSATMVTWFKKLYPDLATGCWASSAPLFAKVDFYEYKEATGDSIRLVGGEACYNRIEKGFAEMEMLFASGRGAEVKAMCQLCNNFDETNDLDLWTFFSVISDMFAALVQTHDDGNIQSACKIIMKGDDDVAGIINFLHILVKMVASEAKCYDLTYKTYMNDITNTEHNYSIMRTWIFQTCNEFGWYQTSRSPFQPFGNTFPIALYTTMCIDGYDSVFTNTTIHERVQETNDMFGALKPGVENVYMTHGQLDPWRIMGIQNPEEATVVPLYAHCKDFTSISSADSPEMRASKEKIAQLVSEWVAE